MKIEGLSDKESMIVTQVVNVVLSVGIAVCYYDNIVDIFCVSAVYFALMNLWDAALAWVLPKFKK